MKYAVVIVTFNRLELFKQCLDCAKNQTYAFSDIVVINNKSTDGTTEFLNGITDERIHVFNEPENGGGAYGFYRGIEQAKKLDVDYITLIDDDAMLKPDYIELIEKARTKFSDVLAFSGTVMDCGTKIDTDHRDRVSDWKKYKRESVSPDEYKTEYFEYDLTSFCGITVAKSVIDKIGLPKKEYFIRGDDTEYSLRIRKETKIINVNKAVLDHMVKRPDKKAPSDEDLYFTYKFYYGQRNNIDIVKTHFGKEALKGAYNTIKKPLIKHRLFCLLKRNKKQIYKYNVQLLKDTLADGKNGVLGKNEKYLPGKRREI